MLQSHVLAYRRDVETVLDEETCIPDATVEKLVDIALGPGGGGCCSGGGGEESGR